MEKVKVDQPGFEHKISDLFELLPTVTNKDSRIVQVLDNSIERIKKKRLVYVISPEPYDQKHIDRIGQLKNCVAVDPGILDLAHQPDEWAGIDDMSESCQVIGLSIDKILN